jgi:hypothetical protein
MFDLNYYLYNTVSSFRGDEADYIIQERRNLLKGCYMDDRRAVGTSGNRLCRLH